MGVQIQAHPHSRPITIRKNKEPSVILNVPKALYSCGFPDILFISFVSNKRVLFRVSTLGRV